MVPLKAKTNFVKNISDIVREVEYNNVYCYNFIHVGTYFTAFS